MRNCLRTLAFVICLLVGIRGEVHAQAGECLGAVCSVAGTQYGPLQTTTSNTFVVTAPTGIFAGSEYYLYSVTSGQTYEWSICSGDGGLAVVFDGQMSLINHSNATVLCTSDDRCDLIHPKIRWTATFTGNVRIQLNEYYCLNNTTTNNVAWRCETCAGNYDPCATIPIIPNCSVATTFTQTGTSGAYSTTSCGYNTPGREMIYEFTAPITGTYNLQVTAYTTSGGYTDFFWKPASGGCNSSGWNCIMDVNNNGLFVPLTPMTFTAGATYYIMVDPEHTGNTSITFNLPCPAAPNPCANIPVISGCAVSTTSTIFAFTGAWNITTCGFNTMGLERMYQFTAPITGTYSLSITSASGGMVDYFWKPASLPCDNTNWNCIGNFNSPGTYPGATPMAFTAGTTYYILLDKETTTSGLHTFQLLCPTPADPTTPSAAPNPLCVGGSVTLTANGVVGTPYWYTGSCGGTQIGTGNTLTVTPGTTTNYFVRNYNGYNFSTNCASVTVTVEPLIGNNTITANQTVCANVFPATLTGSLPTGGNGGYNYQWESSTALPVWSPMPGEINPTYIPNLLSQNTYFRRITTAGLCAPSTSNAVSVTSIPNVTPAVNITTPSNTLCAGNTITFTANGTNRGSAPVYQWYLNFNPVGGNSSTYTSSSFANGDQITLDMTSNAQCATPTQVGANTVTLQVFSIPALPVIQSNSPVCVGNALSFSSNAISGAVYNWTGPGGYNSNNQVDSRNPALVAHSGVYSLSHTVNGCTGPIATATLAVQPSISPITLTASQTLCQGATAAALSASVPTGGTGAYQYQWETSADNSTWGVWSSGTATTLSPGILSQSTYFRTSVTAGVCLASVSNSVVIVIEQPIALNTISSAQTLCAGSSAQTISGSTPTGGNTSYQYQWQSSPTGSVWTNISGQTNLNFNPGAPALNSLFRRLVTAGVCPSSSSNVVQIQIDPLVTNNTIGSAQTICPGFSPAAFTGSIPAGGLGTYTYQWESSSNNSIWTTIPNATGQTFTEGNISFSAYYRRQVNSGACQLTSGNILLTVIPVVTNNTVSTSQTLCVGGTFAQLTGSSPGGGAGTYTYTWETSANNSSWSTIPGATNQSYSPGIAVSSLYYRRVIASGTCTGAASPSVMLLVEQLLGNNSISANQTICNLQNAAPLAGTLPSGGNQIYLYQWETSSDNSTWNDFVGETQQNLSLTGPSANTYYRRSVQAGLCPGNSSSSVSILVLASILQDQIGTSQTICNGSSPAQLTGTQPIGGNGVFQFQWESSLNQSTWQAITSATQQNYSPPALAVSTYYRRGVSSGACTQYNSQVLMTVLPTLGLNQIGSDQTLCPGTAPMVLTGSTPTGSTGLYQYQWESSLTGSGWSSIIGETQSQYTPPALSQTQYYRRVVSSLPCAANASASVRMLVLPVLGNNQIGVAQTICENTSPSALTGTLPTGGDGLYQYQWESSTASTGPWTPISGGTSASYAVPVLTQSAWYRRVVTSFTCSNSSAGVQIQVNVNLSQNTIGSGQTICQGSAPQALTGSAPTGGNGLYQYQWESATVLPSWQNISGGTGIGYTPPVLQRGTYYRRIVISSPCAASSSTPIWIQVDSLLGNNVINASQTICAGQQPSALLGNVPTGGSGAYVYQWESSTDQSSWTSASGGTQVGYTVPVLTQNMYFRRVLSAGICPSVSSTPIAVLVLPAITNNLIGSSQTICIGGIANVLTGTTPGGGTGTYAYQWQSSNNNSTWGSIPAATTQTFSPGNIFVNTYYRLAINSGVCQSTSTIVSIQADQTSGNNIIGSSQTICSGNTPSLFTGSLPTGGLGVFTYQWQSSANQSTWQSITGETNLNYASAPLVVSQYLRRQVFSGGCAPVASNTIVVQVVPVPSATLSGSTVVCPGGSAQLSVNLAGQAPWNFSFTDGTTTTTITGYTSTSYFVSVTPVSSTTYTVSSIFSVCNGLPSNTAVVTVTPVPNATLTGSQTICNGAQAALSVNFTGIGPWNFGFSDGSVSQNVNGVTANPFVFTVSPGAPRTYTLTSVANACPGVVSGTAVVMTYAPPHAFISSNQTICLGVGTTLSINLTGIAPWDVVYTDGTNTYPVNGIPSSPYTFTVTPAFNTTYTMVSVTNGCSGVVAGIADLSVRPAPSASISGSQSICSGDGVRLSVNLTGVAPWNITYTDGTTSTTVTGILSSPYTFAVTPATSRNYTLTNVFATCSGSVSGVASVTVASPAVGFLTGSATICQGASTAIQVGLSGASPWSITYSEGTTAITVTNILSSPYIFTVTPSQSTNYSLISVNSACSGTAAGSATVVVNPVPTATMSGTVPFCVGGTAQVNIQLTGVAPFSVTYNNGGPPVTVNGITSNPYVLSLTPVVSSTYTVTNVSSTCGGIASGSTAVVLESPPNAVLSGTQTTCVSVPAILTANFTGTGPFTLTYTDGFANYTIQQITSNPYSWSVNPGTSQKTYQLLSVTGACAGTVSGTAIVDVEPRPVAILSTPSGVCVGNNAQFSVSITGNAPWDLTYTDGTNVYSENGILSSPHVWTVTPTTTATWSLLNVSNSACIGTVLNTPMEIRVSNPPSVSFTGNTTICGGGNATLSLNLTGTPPFTFEYTDGTTNYLMTGLQGDTTIQVSPSDTVIYRVVQLASSGCSASSIDSVIVNVIPAPSPAWVGADQTICSLNASLVANNPISGTGVWSVVSGTGIIANPNAFSTTISGMSIGLNVVQWTVSNGPCVSAAQMNLFVSTPPTNANAGPNQNICGTNTVMAANTPLNGTGTWSIVSGTGVIADVNNPNTLVSGISAGQLVLMWTITSGNCVSNATVTINASPSAPVAIAGNDQQICSGTTLLSASPINATGQWSLVSGNPVTLTNPNSPQTLVSGLILGSYQFVWTTVSSGCSNTDTMVVQVIPAPTANFSFIQYGFDADFTDLSQGGITAWEWAFGDGAISTLQNPHHTYLQAGSYDVRLIVTNACRRDTIFRNLRIFGVGVEGEIENALNLQVFPNPADQGFFNLKLDNLDGSASEVELRIISVTGAEVYSQTIEALGKDRVEARIVPDRPLSKGLYMLKVRYGNQSAILQQMIR